jgi:hypothetical protein
MKYKPEAKVNVAVDVLGLLGDKAGEGLEPEEGELGLLLENVV